MNEVSGTVLPLQGLRIIEHASFVAGPSGGMTLAQMGADVIRVDPIGGAADYTRWPISQRTGRSLFWTSLNRGKRSVALNTRSNEGRELLVQLVTAPGDSAGILVDNNPGASWLDYSVLAEQRADTIKVHIQGYADGRGAVDYTVNPEVGMPGLTGPQDYNGPVNHAVPAWDLLAGSMATTGLLSALRHRDRCGEGTDLKLALADVALASIANMGWFTEAQELGQDRERVGNYLYGAYGVDFVTADAERVMVVALTHRQWRALCKATETEKIFADLADSMQVDWSDEGTRFKYREVITAILRPWFTNRTLSEAAAPLDGARVLWSRYRDLTQTLEAFYEDDAPSVLAEIEQPGVGTVITSRSPLRPQSEYGPSLEAPALGEHTEEVLSEVLGLASHELGRMHDQGTIALSE